MWAPHSSLEKGSPGASGAQWALHAPGSDPKAWLRLAVRGAGDEAGWAQCFLDLVQMTGMLGQHLPLLASVPSPVEWGQCAVTSWVGSSQQPCPHRRPPCCRRIWSAGEVMWW